MKLTKKVVSLNLNEALVEDLDRRRGPASRSYFAGLAMERGLAAWDLSFLPPPLVGAQVEHDESRHPEKRVWSVSHSAVHPSKDTQSGRAAWTVNHTTSELGANEEVIHGRHWLALDRCGACQMVVRDFPRGAGP